ncbi:MAG: ABC transporter ATP-binding protein, partial [Corynebacterium sp.]|nr:ABC transporter ATP-binding protein [Corynebacterium sp.]
MRQLWAILAPHWRMALWACIATVGVTTAELFIPLLTGNVVDIAVSQQGYHTFPQLSPVASATLTLILVALTRWGFQFLRRYTAGRLSFDTISELRVRLLARLLHTDGPTQDQIRTGQVVSRSISDVQSIQGLVAMLPLAIGNLLQLLVTIIVMIALSPSLAIASLIWLPLIAWFARTSKQPLTQATHAAQQQAADVATRVEETITGIRIVQGFAQEQREVTALQRASILLYQARLHAAKVTARIQPLLEQLPQLALVCTIIAGAWMASQGTISVGIFVAFAMYVSRVTGVVRMLGNMSVRFHSGLASVARVSEISELTPDLPNGTLPVPDGPLSLEFQGVHFGGTLRDFSLKVPATATVVAVGPPASGKTLALQLAARFYDPDNGEILLQGIPLREYDRTEVRNAMAVVFDEPFLFEASIRDNLTLGTDATEEELWSVLEAAQAAEFVRALPDSLDALVGERGLTLSGGQRQRIVLARALLRRPRILLLDDATSAIDAATEANIFQAIETQFKETTVFAIAHRTSMTKLADYIAIMDAGHVVEVVPQASAKHSATFQRAMDLHAAVATRPATRPSLNPTREAEHEFNFTLDPIAAECTPPGPQPKPVEITTPFSPYHMLRQTALGIVAVVLLLFGTVSADLAIPSLVRSVVDRSVTTGNADILVSFALGGTGIVIAAWCIGVLRTLLTARIGERLLYALRVKSYQHVLNLDLAYFERTRTGALLTRMTTDIDNLSSFLQSALAQTIVASTTLIGIMIMLIVTAPSLALVAFSGIPIVIISTLIFRRNTSPLYTQAREELSAINAEFHEAVSGIRVIQMHGTQSHVLERFQQQCQAYRRTRVRSQIAIATYFPGTNAIAQVSRALVIGFGASAVLNGDLSTGVLIAFLLYMGLLFDPIQELSQLFD